MHAFARRIARLALLTALLAPLPAAPTHAAPIGVDTFADGLAADGACSLREAIAAANTDAPVDTCPAGSGADIIQLPAGTYLLTLSGSPEDLNQSGDLDIQTELTILGADRSSTIVDGGALADRILDVRPGGALTLAKLALRNGGGAALAQLDGGAIFSAGSLALESAELAYNAAGHNGGAIFNQGGTLRIANSVIRDNTAGLANQSDGGGGGIFSQGGSTSLSNSIVNNNSAFNGDGGGIRSTQLLQIADSWVHDNLTNTRGGGIYNTATTIITGTVLDANRAGHDGGNIYSGNDDGDSTLALTSSELRAGVARYGGAIFNNGALTLSSDSLALNHADTGGALYTSALSATVQLNNVTLAENTHDAVAPGAAISNLGAALVVRNSLVGQNGAWASCAGAIISAGHNLDASTSCGFGSVGDKPSTDPLLGPLPAVARTPNSFPLLAGSPAVNTGDNATCAAHDIFGRARPHGLACDIGAYETNSAPTAAAGSYAIAEDQPLAVAAPGLLAGASDPDGDPLQIQRAGWPTHGQLALNADGSLSYTPPADFYGDDQFAYYVSDGGLATQLLVASITVAPVNDLPTARDDTATATRATALAIAGATLLGNDSDPDGDGLFISSVGPRSSHNGAAELAGDIVRYTPPIGFNGIDSFGYTASDGHGGSATATVRVQVHVSWLFTPIARR